MNGYRYVKPISGLVVRDPIQKTPMPEEGRWVPWVGREGTYWHRRLKDGSIVLCNPPLAINEEKKEQEVKPKKEVKK